MSEATQMTGAVFDPSGSTAGEGPNAPQGSNNPLEFHIEGMPGEYVLIGRNKEEIERAKAWLTHRAGKSLDKLPLLEILRNARTGQSTGLNVERTTNAAGEMRRELRLTDEVMTNIDNWAAENFYQGAAPTLTHGTGGFVGSNIDLSETAPHKILANAATASGYISTAQQLVADNYADLSMPAINLESIQDAGLQTLMTQLFGNPPPGGFHEGHLNVLKAMNLASGDVSQPASGWQLTEGGQVLSSALNAEGTDFISANHLFEMSSNHVQGKMQAAQLYFNPSTGELINSSPEGVETALTTLRADGNEIYEALSAGKKPEPLPAGMELPGEVSALLTLVREKSGGFNTADLNTAIAQGLVQYDRQTGQVSLTAQGQSLLKAANPEIPADSSDAPAVDQGDQEFWNATNTLVNDHDGAGLKLVDYMEGRDGGKDRSDGRFYGYYVTDSMAPMLEGETPLLNVDSPVWEEAGLGNLNTEARQQIINSLGVWAKDRGRVDQVAGFYGAEGKEGRVITRDEAQAWLGRNSHSWVAEPSDRADEMLLGNAQPDSRWAKYKKDSDAAKPYGAQLGQLIKNQLGLDMNNMNDDELNQALFILETTGYVKMPTSEESTKIIRLTDQGNAALAQPAAPVTADTPEPIEEAQTLTDEEQPA